MRVFKSIMCIFLCALCLTLCCCGEKNQSLTREYTRSASVPVYDFFADEPQTPDNYQEFTSAYLDFASNLLKNAESDESCVLSPLSLYTVLSMTASGTSGKTLRELEKTLGQELRISEINTFIHYLNERVKVLNSEKGFVNSANSIWIRDNFSVKAQFLQTAVNYYDSEVFRTALNADEINGWIEDKTDGEIKDMLSELDNDTALVLVNALLFDDEWLTEYEESDIYDAGFRGTKGEELVSFMSSNEMFIESKDAKGMIKSYKNTPCKFVAILPDENISVDEYVESLSGSKLENLLGSANGINRCVAHLPQFDLRSKLSLNDTAKAMGIELMFTDEANFDGLTMSDGLKVTDILQESFVELNSKGTKAGSSTAIAVKPGSPNAPESDILSLVFDRPFVFMIVENESNLPLFIGTVKSIG
ncbi:MAG: serpin family protein [Clostridia bacterium]|nr:serpin family protein [Clostridia bacterium]